GAGRLFLQRTSAAFCLAIRDTLLGQRHKILALQSGVHFCNQLRIHIAQFVTQYPCDLSDRATPIAEVHHFRHAIHETRIARCKNAVRQQPDPKGLRPRPTLPSVASDVLVSRQRSADALKRLPRHTSRAWLRARRPWPPDRQSPPSSMRSAPVRLMQLVDRV